MKIKPPPDFVVVAGGLPSDDGYAAVSRSGRLRIVVSWDGGWDHVSVSHPTRCPTWEEMSYLARHFWPDKAAMQLHVPASDHINCHPFCLHLWCPQQAEIPRPPSWMVGPSKTPTIAVLSVALALFAGWLTLPTAPTPIDDSLPSSGVHSPARGLAPGKDAWSGPLWST